MGLHWLLVSTGTEKFDKIGNRLEMLPPLIRLDFRVQVFVGTDAWVEMTGSKLEAKTTEATRFHKAILVISWLSSSTARSTAIGVI